MTHYTLFVDESGSFGKEQRNESWVVGGLLTSMRFSDFESYVKKSIKPIQEGFNLPNTDYFHATEIRNRDKDKGHQIVRDVFSKLIELLDKSNNANYFITTVNTDKISSNNAERNYRLMLLDLIIQSEKIIEENGDDISSFELIIASRTIDGERQTDFHHINDEIIKSLAAAIESDLVAMGRLYLLGEKLNYQLENAKYKWGLIYADFLCNMTYNSRFKENKDILDNLEKSGKLISYQTFLSAELRKVLSHEVNQNYGSAIFDCLRILDRKNNNDKVANILNRLLKTALINSGTTGVKVNFETILEKIWRDKIYYKGYDKKAKILLRLAEYINKLNVNYAFKNYELFNFQLNNLVLLCYNHIADTDNAIHVIEKQEIMIQNLIANPSNYNTILDYYIRAIEVLVNNLQFDKALQKSEKYNQIIDEYFDFWQLINENIRKQDFLSSEYNIKAKSNLIRTQILNAGNTNELLMEEMVLSIDELLLSSKNGQDISRLKCQKLLLLCKTNHFDEAIEVALENFNQTRMLGIDLSFDYLFLLYVSNQKMLLKEDKNLLSTINTIIDNEDDYSINSKRYPYPIILRELSLFYYLYGNKNKAIDFLKLSNKYLLEILNKYSRTTKFLKMINDIQSDLINHKMINVNQKSKETSEKFDIGNIKNISDIKELLIWCRNYITS